MIIGSRKVEYHKAVILNRFADGTTIVSPKFHNIYISPSQFEADFISEAHSEKELDRFVKTAGKFRG
ncbi:MAG: hypothetical protein FWF54_01920 [Candidatus Azobacteroides sp.]|nr:hypothetical protein [Candidatus Azobacteroides sp.]